MFVLLGQVLNARRPVRADDVGADRQQPDLDHGAERLPLVLGRATGPERVGPFTADQELLLGLGSTLGIVVQFLILMPYLAQGGFRYRPRFDFRGTGLGHTLRLGVWTVLFVMVNQVAYLVVIRLASSGTVRRWRGHRQHRLLRSFLIMMVPHAIVTVSLATAILPRLSRLRRRPAAGRPGQDHRLSLRTALVVVLPFAALLPISVDGGRGRGAFGAGAGDTGRVRADPGPVRRRPGVLHLPLPDAARLLRPGADPPGLLDPVRHLRHQHRRRVRAGRRRHRRAHRARAGGGLRSRRTPWARRCATPCCAVRSAASSTWHWCASWSGWSSPVLARASTAVAVERRWPGLGERPGDLAVAPARRARRLAGVVVLLVHRPPTSRSGRSPPATDAASGPVAARGDRPTMRRTHAPMTT